MEGLIIDETLARVRRGETNPFAFIVGDKVVYPDVVYEGDKLIYGGDITVSINLRNLKIKIQTEDSTTLLVVARGSMSSITETQGVMIGRLIKSKYYWGSGKEFYRCSTKKNLLSMLAMFAGHYIRANIN